MGKLRITWVKSAIDCSSDQKATIRALGLRRLHQTMVKEASPTLKGMLFKVKHLVVVVEVADHEAA